VLSREPLTPAILIPLALCLLERLARISVLTTRSPVTTARCLDSFKIGESRLGGLPDLSALKPLQLGIRMPLLQPAERR